MPMPKAEPQAIASRCDGEILSVPAVRKDGTRVSVEFTIVPFTDDGGRMIGIAAIMRDATARFEELRALRKELAAHRAASAEGDGSQDAVSVAAQAADE